MSTHKVGKDFITFFSPSFGGGRGGDSSKGGRDVDNSDFSRLRERGEGGSQSKKRPMTHTYVRTPPWRRERKRDRERERVQVPD